MTAETVVGAVPAKAEFRTCQYTGLKVDVAAEALIKANAVAAVVFLLIGGLMGLLVALTRWPAVHLLDCARLYVLALEKGSAGARYHAVGEEGVRVRDIAEVIGQRLNIPIVAK